MSQLRDTFRQARPYREVPVAVVLLVTFVYLRLNLDDHVRGRRGRTFIEPEFWPGLLLTFGVVLSVVYLVLTILRARGAVSDHGVGLVARAEETAEQSSATIDETGGGPPDTVETAPPTTKAPPQRRNLLGLGGAAALLFAYIWFMPTLGFVPISLVFCVAFLLLVGERRWWLLVALPLAVVAFVLGIFTRLLVVPLPRGSGFFLELSTYLY